MQFIDSIKLKMEERKKLFRFRDSLFAVVRYQTPGCGGLLKGPNGFFEEKSIQRVLKDYGILVVNYKAAE